jgi:hypothetical protein
MTLLGKNGVRLRNVLTVNSSVTFDTGSVDFILHSSKCTAARGCALPGSKFNSEKSPTYSTQNRAWRIQFATGVGVGVGSAASPKASGTIGFDSVSVAGLKIEKQGIGLIETQSPDLFGNTGITGIFGMGTAGAGTVRSTPFFQNLVTQKKINSAIFSLFLTPKAVGKAEMTWGGTNPAKYVGAINYVPIVSRSGEWNITFDELTVNGRKTRIGRRSVIADSGTSNMVAPEQDAKEIYAMISPNIKMLDPKGQWGAYGIECSEIPKLNSTITFTIGGKRYTIPSQELSVGPFPGKPQYCQTLFNSLRQPLWIIGGSLMKYYYTVWDTGNKRMGWATVEHSPKIQ